MVGGLVMRWLIVHPGPEFSVHDLYIGWAEALRELGEHVLEYNMPDRLTFYDSVAIETGARDAEGHPEMRKALTHDEAIGLAANGLLSACYQAWPDVILIVSGFFTPPGLLEIMRARRHKIVMLMTETPYEDPRQLALAPYADVCLLNDPVTIGAYQDACPGAVEYSPHAYRPVVHYPRRTAAMEWDLAFSGTGYESRIKFFEAMGLDGLRVALAGNWIQLKDGSPLRRWLIHDVEDCVDNEVTSDLYQSAWAGINMYRREAEQDATAAGWAVGPREIEMSACGLFYLRDPRPEGDQLLPMLPTFDGPQDAGEKLRWWLDHDSLREEAAGAARVAVVDRRFISNARMLLRLLDRQPVTI
jgi:spore maturation protein CgeB